MILFLYALICIIWGSTWLAIKIGLDGVPPFLAAGLRFLIAASILFGIILLRKKKLRFNREDRICIFSSGLLSFTCSYIGVYWSEQYISSGLTAIFFSTMPLLVALLSHFWTKAEILNGRKIAGIAVGMAGTTILFWPHETVSWIKLTAMAGALASTVFASVNVVIMKKYSKYADIYVLNACGMAIGAVCLLALSLSIESYANLSWSWSNGLALLYLAGFGSVAAFLAYYSLLKVIDATLLSLITLIFPIIALALGWIFLGETLSPSAGIGILTVLLGVAVAIGLPIDRKSQKKQNFVTP